LSSPLTSADAQVIVIGAGVVGAASAHALARRGVSTLVLEAEREPALGASGTNSGIVHTGFDSPPGELETELILRAGLLREDMFRELGVALRRCGALLAPLDAEERETVSAVAEGARRNGVEAELHEGGSLAVPGESLTDPVAYTRALLDAAQAGSAELRSAAPVEAIRRATGGLELGLADGGSVRCAVAVNCAGLYADAVARMAGDDSFEVYPRKGEFFVFEPPGGQPLERILLPVPTKRTKGVLVFPTTDGKVVAGPTAHDQDDKRDWTVRESARDEVMEKAARLLPALERAEPIASYAGLRPAGRGVNYVIGPAAGCPELINVAAIRSTGLTASLGIGERVAGLVAEHGIELGAVRPLPAPRQADSEPWWLRASRRAELAA
jgi:glycerol-3-phosphate dehydrogenase